MSGITRRNVLLTGAAATALGGAAGRARGAAPKIKLVFSTPPSTYALPHFVAQDQGWLKKAGLDVDEIWLNNDANAIRVLIAGEANFAGLTTFPTYAAIAAGAKVKAIASWQPRVDYILIASPKYTSLDSLVEARIAAASLGGITTELPRVLFEKHHIDTSKMQFFSVGGHEARLQAVLAGKADAAMVGLLFSYQGQQTAPINVLAEFDKEFPGMGYVYLVAKDSGLSDPALRAALTDYVRIGVIEASRFIMKNPQRAAEVMQKRTPDIKLDLLRKVVDGFNAKRLWGINGGLDPAVTEFTTQLAAKFKVTPRLVTPAEVRDGTIIDGLIKTMGRA